MPFHNLAVKHLSQTERDEIRTKISELNALFSDTLRSLLPSERSRYGAINEKNKNLVDSVREFRNNQPDKSSPEVDWEEFEKDYQMRKFYESVINSLQGMLDGCKSTKILHDHDNYQAAITDFRYTKYKNQTSAVGYQTKAEVYAEFFAKKPKS